MKLSTIRRRLKALQLHAASVVIFGSVASAQITYEWADTIGTGAGALWDTTTPGILWDDLTTPVSPATDIPGSLLGSGASANDVVLVKNARTDVGTQAAQQVRLDVDAGTVDSVRVGGYKGAAGSSGTPAPAAGAWLTQFDVRGAGAQLTVANDLILGDVDTTMTGAAPTINRAGQLFLLTNNNASVTVSGNVLRGSPSGANRIIVRGTGLGGLSLAGNIDTLSTGGSASGTRGIDLRIEAQVDTNPTKLNLSTGGQQLSVQDFWVGERFNASANGTFTLDSANVVEANQVRVGATGGNAMNGAARTATGTLTIDDPGSSIDVFGGNGQNGNIQIGFAAGNYPQDQTVDGTLTVSSGRIGASNVMHVGMVTENVNATGVISSTGTVNLNAGGTTLIGRVNSANNLAGNITVGREGNGSLNVNAGTLEVYGGFNLGGNNNDGRDRASAGTLNLAAGTSLKVKDVDPDSALVLTNDGVTARDKASSIGGGALVIGNDGVGTINADGATIVVGRGNLVLGQSVGAINNQFDGNADGTNDDLVGITNATISGPGGNLQNYDVKDRFNQFLFDTNPANGDITSTLDAPDGDGALNYRLTPQGVAKVLAQISRGTLNLTNGADVTVGGSYTATAGDPDPEPNVSLNYNQGGGDIVVDASVLRVGSVPNAAMTLENSINMGGVAPGRDRNTLTIRNGGVVTAGRDLSGVGNVNAQASTIAVVGDGNTLLIEGDLVLNSGTILTFDFDGTTVGDFGVTVVGQIPNANGAQINLENFTTALETLTDDITLIDAFVALGNFSRNEGAPVYETAGGNIWRFSTDLASAGGTGGVGVGLWLDVPPPAITYKWIGDVDDTTNLNNLSWTDPLFWQDVDDTTTPPLTYPGGPGNGLMDAVTVCNTRANGTQQVRLTNTAVTIGTLTIGGDTTAGADGGNAITQVSVRGNSGSLTIAELILGDGGVGGQAGQLLVNNAGSSATVTGDVLAGSNNGNNRLQVTNNTLGGLTLNGVSGLGTYSDTNGTPDPGDDIIAGVTVLREIDLFIQANDDVNTSRLDLGTGNFYSLEELRVGTSFNQFPNIGASFTLDNGNTVSTNLLRVSEAGGNANNSQPAVGTGELSVIGTGANVDIDVLGSNGQNGNIQLGRMFNTLGGGSAIGTLNVGLDGVVTASNVLQLGNVTGNAGLPAVPGDMANTTASSAGILNVTDANAVVSIGRIAGNNMQAGNIIAGIARAGTGDITLNDGTINSFGVVYFGGDSNQGTDRYTAGTLTIGGGTLNIGADPNWTANGADDSAGLNGELLWNGNVRDTLVALGGANLEIGRDGSGSLTQTGGVLNVFRGNLVLGQTGVTVVNNAFDGNMDGTVDDLVGVADGSTAAGNLANYDLRDERNQFLFSTDPLVGDITSTVDAPDADGALNYRLTQQGLAKVLVNSSRGTIDLSGGTINVGATQGSDPDTGTELFHDLNYNNGGGDITIFGTGAINVERNFNMQANVQAVETLAVPRNTLFLDEMASLNIGFGSFGDTTTGDLNAQRSDITVFGGGTDVDISGDLNMNSPLASDNASLAFDFDGTVVTDFNFDVAGVARIGNVRLDIFDSGILSGPTFGDILLIDAGNRIGSFRDGADAIIAEGAAFGNYTFTYALGGVPGKIGLVDGAVIPDADGDGISDAYELANTGSITGLTGLPTPGDYDGDGVDDYTEAQFGTDSSLATGALSFPQLVITSYDLGTTTSTLEFAAGKAGLTYQLTASDDLTFMPTSDIGASQTPGADGLLNFTDNSAVTIFRGYRLDVTNPFEPDPPSP